MEALISLHTDSAEQTAALGRALGAALRPGDFLALVGDLGAGKTCFSRGVAEGAGVASEDISSPTYSIVQRYSGRIPLFHADLYRLGDPDELYATGYFDLLAASEGAFLVEWAEQVPGAIPAGALVIRLAAVPDLDSRRAMKLEPRGARATELARVISEPARRTRPLGEE